MSNIDLFEISYKSHVQYYLSRHLKINNEAFLATAKIVAKHNTNSSMEGLCKWIEDSMASLKDKSYFGCSKTQSTILALRLALYVAKNIDYKYNKGWDLNNFKEREELPMLIKPNRK